MLTDKQKLFADEYLIDLNATRAYRAVYKNVKSDEVAAAASARLLRNVKVAEYIEQRMKDRSKRTEITQDFVLNELFAIAKAKGTDFAQIVEEKIIQNGHYIIDPDTGQMKTLQVVKVTPTDKLSEDKQKAIAGIKEGKYGIEVSTCDKVRALELLGKHLGMFKDKVEVSGQLDTGTEKLNSILDQIKKHRGG
ncbi:MAG: terminase small subunit [Herbinix sp.]|jgi:phage terminase small subunit|nr:terminase small subunit [Herbinix sp.]